MMDSKNSTLVSRSHARILEIFLFGYVTSGDMTNIQISLGSNDWVAEEPRPCVLYQKRVNIAL